jgi:TPR repeat protein
MARFGSSTVLPFLPILLASGCGPGSVASAIRPPETTAAQALNEPSSGAECKEVGREGKPLVVDWKPEQRGDLEVAMSQGVAVVEYDCSTLKLLDNCHVDGSYGFKGVVLKQQLVRLTDADEVKVNLPLSGAALAANLEGAMGRGASLDLATALVGNRVSTRTSVSRSELTGICDGATHFVRAANIGAFVLEQSTKAEVKTAAEIFKVSASGQSASSKQTRQADGDIDACQSSSSDSEKPPSNCAALVRISLVSITDAPAAAPAPKAAGAPEAIAVKDEDEGCPSGLSLVEGKCTKPTAAEKHVCKRGDLADCKAQCEAGEAWSCSRFGAVLLTSAGDKDAAAAFQRSCDLGHPGGCSNFGLLLAKGAGVGKDDAKAATFFEKACSGGDPTGCFNLATMSYEGRGVAKDAARAAALFRQSCDAGNAAGCVNLGAAYDDGLGVAKDPAKALALYKRACEGDKAEGCTNLGVAYSSGAGIAEDQAAATKFYARGCALRSARSCGYLGKRYRDGKGVEKDLAKAKDALKSACDLGDTASCDALKGL